MILGNGKDLPNYHGQAKLTISVGSHMKSEVSRWVGEGATIQYMTMKRASAILLKWGS